MTRLEKAEKLLWEMTPAEKAQVLQRVVRDLGDAFPGIESAPASPSTSAWNSSRKE
jgi:hypothetical protein